MSNNDSSRVTQQATWTGLAAKLTAKLLPKKEAPRAPSLGIVIPSGDLVNANTAMALSAQAYMLGRSGFDLKYFNQKGSIIAINRNNGIEQCRLFSCDWCLMIDSDMAFPPDAFLKLMTHAAKERLDIIGATYAKRAWPHTNNAVPLQDDKPEQAVIEGITEVLTLPAGFLLIRMDALHQMVRPYFRFGFVEEGAHPEEYLAGAVPDDGMPRIIGEDTMFCILARKAGLRVMIDTLTSFEMVHFGEVGYKIKKDWSGSPDEECFERFEHVTAAAS